MVTVEANSLRSEQSTIRHWERNCLQQRGFDSKVCVQTTLSNKEKLL